MFKKPEISKVTDFNQFMLWFSFLIFIDCYLIAFGDKNILDINFNYIKDHLGHIPVIIVLYIFSMATMSSISQYVVSFLNFLKEQFVLKFFDKKYERTDMSNRMADEHVLNIATIKNNSVLYNQYVEHKKIISDILLEKKIAAGLVFLCILNYFLSNENVIPILKAYELYFENPQSWYVEVLNIIPILVIFYIFTIAFKNIELINYMFIENDVQEILLKKGTEKQNDK